MTARETTLDLQSWMSEDIVGQEHILERFIIGLPASGNLLVEGLPGPAKTRAIKSLGQHLEAPDWLVLSGSQSTGIRRANPST
jgi:MoxR-like ATPase